MRAKFAHLQAPVTQSDGKAKVPRRAKARAKLAEVYRKAQLPPATRRERLPAGERRMLAGRGLEAFARGLYETTVTDPSPRRRARAKAPTAAREPGRPAGRPK
jgi:hypothetical protein